jgi:hypothetical protein
VKLEDQRSAARLKVCEAIPEFAVFNCNVPGCQKSYHSSTFMPAFKDAVNLCTDWPPAFSSLSLRLVLRKIEHAGDVVVAQGAYCQHNSAKRAGVPSQIMVPAARFAQFANDINDNMAGMCLKCVKSGSFITGPCKVEGHWRPSLGWDEKLSRS